MDFFEVKQSELKQITLFLIEKRIVLHRKIPPDRIPDFTGYENRKVEIILDRNLFVYLISLLENGELKDHYKRKIITSLIFWIEFNGFGLNSSIALTEYTNFKKENSSANWEYNISNRLFIDYLPRNWLDLAFGHIDTIPRKHHNIIKEPNFNIESSHFKMHYIEMLKLAQAFYNEEISIIEKFKNFFEWIYSNIIVCRYTTCLSAKILSGKSKIFNLVNTDFKELDKICINQAWDLTYLSIWSTFYWYEQQEKKVYLFATADKELKEIFSLTNQFPERIFTTYLGKQRGREIGEIMSSTYLPRAKKEINDKTLNEPIKFERDKLEQQIIGKYDL